MYPAQFFGLFPSFPQENKVFVAMGFDKQFQRRWEQVIMPSIVEIGLEPHRVDASRISDSILTEILSGIGKSRLILADVSVDSKGVRNGNVMYEVGIAHAMRQPQEVVLFRSDKEKLLFDIANIRINTYDPDGDPNGAGRNVKGALSEALREIDTTKSLAVQRAAEALDQEGFLILAEAAANRAVRHPQLRTMRQVMANMARVNAIPHLLELGLLTALYPKLPSETLEKLEDKEALENLVYVPTPLGEAVVNEIGNRFGIRELLRDPGAVKKLNHLLDKQQ
jgi:hypothetical protein